MRTLNQNLLKNVDKEMIGQNGKDAMQVELKSLEIRKVFGPVVQTNKDVKLVG